MKGKQWRACTALCIQTACVWFPHNVDRSTSGLQMCDLRLFLNITWEENCTCFTLLCHSLSTKTGRGGEGRRREVGVEVLHQYQVMSLRVLAPRGAPWATTSHPSPYALTHFTFIRTSNDFPPMKVREEHNESLVGEKWNLHPATAIGPTFRKRCKGNI